MLSLLTSKCEDIQSNQIQSLFVVNGNVTRPVDLSDFFTHHYFPKLQHIWFIRCAISSWDLLKSRTGALTELWLDFMDPSPTPTTLQLLSILGSNPLLQEVTLLHQVIPNDHVDTSPFRVPLHYILCLCLSGDSQCVFKLLQQLDYPATLYWLSLELQNCTEANVSQIVGPHLQSHLQHCGRSPRGLELSLSSDKIYFGISNVDGMDVLPAEVNEVVRLCIQLDQSPPKDLLGKLALDLIAYIP